MRPYLVVINFVDLSEINISLGVCEMLNEIQ